MSATIIAFPGWLPTLCACGAGGPPIRDPGCDAWLEQHITECPIQRRFRNGEGVMCMHGVPILDGRHADGRPCGPPGLRAI